MVDGETRDYMKKENEMAKAGTSPGSGSVLYAAEHEGTGGC